MDEPGLNGRLEKNVDRCLQKIKDSPDIFPEDKELLLDFFPYLRTSLDLSTVRYLRAFYSMERVAKAFKNNIKVPMKGSKHKHIVQLMGLIEKHKLTDSGTSGQETRRDFKYFAKRFYQYLAYIEAGEKFYLEDTYPDLVSWIKPSKGTKVFTPIEKDDLITREELEKLVDSAPNIRNKAFYLVAFEGGFRLGELYPMHIRDVRFERDGALMKVKEDEDRNLKNKFAKRTVFITGRAAEMVSRYVKTHPFRDDPDAFLWLKNTQGGPRDYWPQDAIRRALEKDLKRIGITRKQRKIHPHIFRHSKLHEMYKEGLPAVICKRFAGHSPTSKMEAVYTHVDDEDVKDELKKHYGLVDKEDEEKSLACPFCGQMNKQTWILCESCYNPLKEGARLSLPEGDYVRADEYNKLIEINKETQEWLDTMMSSQIRLTTLVMKHNPKFAEEVKREGILSKIKKHSQQMTQVQKELSDGLELTPEKPPNLSSRDRPKRKK
ncbi:tyrosine-type recombinase/integrase [Candidatus Altiarchaeota archaeon]